MSAAEIAALLAIWSVTGLVTEVPSGALSDRCSRRRVLAAGGAVQAAAYTVWLVAPSFVGFALGFVLWGIGTSLYSGTVEALLYERLTELGAQDQYASLRGHVTAATHVGQVPAAFAATGLIAWGGYAAVGWVSVGICLAGAALTWTFPDPPRTSEPPDPDEPTATDADLRDTPVDDLGYLATLRAGLAEAVGSRIVRGALLAAALVGGIDALEEFYPLIVGERVPVVAVPVVLLVVTLCGAAGAALGGRAGRLRAGGLAAVVALAGIALVGAEAAGIAGLVAVGLCYGLQQCALVVTDTRVQERLSGRARATATSVSALGMEVVALAVFAGWAFGGTLAVAVGILAVAPVVWWTLRSRRGQ